MTSEQYNRMEGTPERKGSVEVRLPHAQEAEVISHEAFEARRAEVEAAQKSRRAELESKLRRVETTQVETFEDLFARGASRAEYEARLAQLEAQLAEMQANAPEPKQPSIFGKVAEAGHNIGNVIRLVTGRELQNTQAERDYMHNAVAGGDRIQYEIAQINIMLERIAA